MIPFLVILTIFVGGVLAIYWVAKPSYERQVESSADEVRADEVRVDEVRVVEHPPGYYMPQWKPAGSDWWIDLENFKCRSLEKARVSARQHRDYFKACEEPERIHDVDDDGGAE